MSSSFADGAEVPVTEAALPRWMATLRRWKRKVAERGSEVVYTVSGYTLLFYVAFFCFFYIVSPNS